MKKNSLKNGFTLIELLVVIFIIGILVALIMANILGARQRAQDTQRKSDLQQLKRALMMYYGENQSYPTADQVNEPNSVLVPSFIKELPEYNGYVLDVANDTFRAYVLLDNISDKDVAISQSRCGVSSPPDDGAYYVCAD